MNLAGAALGRAGWRLAREGFITRPALLQNLGYRNDLPIPSLRAILEHKDVLVGEPEISRFGLIASTVICNPGDNRWQDAFEVKAGGISYVFDGVPRWAREHGHIPAINLFGTEEDGRASLHYGAVNWRCVVSCCPDKRGNMRIVFTPADAGEVRAIKPVYEWGEGMDGMGFAIKESSPKNEGAVFLELDRDRPFVGLPVVKLALGKRLRAEFPGKQLVVMAHYAERKGEGAALKARYLVVEQ